MDPVKIFVGCDRSQYLAVPVLEYSIKRHTNLPVEVIPISGSSFGPPLDPPLSDVVGRDARDPRQRSRTGFSFARFAIPKLCGYEGRAIWLDADMQVFGDIAELWTLPFDGAKVIVQDDLPGTHKFTRKTGAPPTRVKQSAVMVLDCSRLDWDTDTIIDSLDASEYTYAQLMFELCILEEDEIKYGVPFNWNSLEHFDESTRLIHYTDMSTQPWVSAMNPLDSIWYGEVRHMVRSGALTLDRVEEEVRHGYLRPSLLRDLRWSHRIPGRLKPLWRRANRRLDWRAGYRPHRRAHENAQAAKALIKSEQDAVNHWGPHVGARAHR
jgi:hypothetical protein